MSKKEFVNQVCGSEFPTLIANDLYHLRTGLGLKKDVMAFMFKVSKRQYDRWESSGPTKTDLHFWLKFHDLIIKIDDEQVVNAISDIAKDAAKFLHGHLKKYCNGECTTYLLDIINKAVGTKLKLLRLIAGMSIAEAAELFDFSDSSYKRLEKLPSNYQLNYVQAFKFLESQAREKADALGIEYDWAMARCKVKMRQIEHAGGVVMPNDLCFETLSKTRSRSTLEAG